MGDKEIFKGVERLRKRGRRVGERGSGRKEENHRGREK